MAAEGGRKNKVPFLNLPHSDLVSNTVSCVTVTVSTNNGSHLQTTSELDDTNESHISQEKQVSRESTRNEACLPSSEEKQACHISLEKQECFSSNEATQSGILPRDSDENNIKPCAIPSKSKTD